MDIGNLNVELVKTTGESVKELEYQSFEFSELFSILDKYRFEYSYLEILTDLFENQGEINFSKEIKIPYVNDFLIHVYVNINMDDVMLGKYK